MTFKTPWHLRPHEQTFFEQSIPVFRFQKSNSAANTQYINEEKIIKSTNYWAISMKFDLHFYSPKNFKQRAHPRTEPVSRVDVTKLLLVNPPLQTSDLLLVLPLPVLNCGPKQHQHDQHCHHHGRNLAGQHGIIPTLWPVKPTSRLIQNGDGDVGVEAIVLKMKSSD